MTSNTHDAERADTVEDGGAYAALHVEDDALVIYDQENPSAWVQSDLVVDLGEGE